MSATPAAAKLDPLFDAELLQRDLAGELHPAAALKRLLKRGDAELRRRFEAGEAVATLVRGRAALVDAILAHSFRLHSEASRPGIALVAVGGYGRGELHPCSDVDILLLVSNSKAPARDEAIGTFITALWDLGLEVGHSVRTVDECVEQARTDVGVATSLMEARKLLGDETLYQRLRAATGPEQLWPSQEFFAAKLKEQQQRHAKYHDTAYKLEPNVKESPGGLRDIQTVGWVAKRHFGADTLHGLVDHGFLTEDEYQRLQAGQEHLWRLRFALHLLHGRREDRLLFDGQIKLARLAGFEDAPHNLGVEQFMQQYYRVALEISRLNEMLLQLFDEAILNPRQGEAVPLSADFADQGGFLAARSADLFERKPAALLGIFHVLEQHPRLRGVSAETIRQLRRSLDRIDEGFRADPAHRDAFMDILKEPQGVTHELRRMNRYGVLGRYLPAFGAVAGRMQYDLFHAYTVDEHTLFVVSNLRRFALARYDQEFPLCSRIMQALPKPEVAYLAGLFHDIAKGRGGDHSELGAVEAEQFCLEHGLSRYEARLCAWLVQRHLLLSITAQKRDISDPDVIQAFAAQVGDQMHLDYLYVLTVADVRATNPELWNSWKAGLFSELYQRASGALRRGTETPLDKEELIGETQRQAQDVLKTRGLETGAVRAVWQSLSEEYFLRHSADEIAWHTANLASRLQGDTPLVFLRPHTERGGTAVCVYSRHDDFIFGRVTAVLSQLGLTVLDARIVPVGSDASLDTYVVLEDTGAPIEDPERLSEIEQVLLRETGRRNASPIAVTRRAPRQVRMFTTATDIQFSQDPRNRRTVLEITAGDRPGLLSQIGQALKACGLRLQNAKITTVGERAEDVFFVTDAAHGPLDAGACETLRGALLARIGENA
ncbi:MAG TPA: [protein-PII] uridylyltransferase [Gammaproteobacteria bacterium]|nr:[protein-PII] uridylyltransferase [Gammaproteobacteria bacterium]